MNKAQIVKKWTEENRPIGEMLGYPDCCIKQFCDQPPQFMKGNPSRDDRRRLRVAHLNGDYTGFIPCSDHAKQISDGKITLDSLIDKEKRSKEHNEFIIPDFPKA